MRKFILFVFLFLAAQCTVYAQTKALEKANKLYKEKRYASAAKLFETALEEKASLGVKTKLAYCYRINNRMEAAEKLYAEITAQKKAKPRTFFYYGEALMSNGKYEEAKVWFNRYQNEEPDDEAVYLMLAACDYIPSIVPFFSDVYTEEFPFNSEADDSTPTMWGDKLVFSSDRASGGLGGTKKSGFTGRQFINLFYSEKSDTAFTEPKVFSGKLSVSNKNTGNPSFTADNSRIFFTRNGVELSKRSVYNLSLFTAESSGGARWKNVEVLPFCSKEYNFMHPAISPDGKTLYYISDKSRGQGGTDIWVSRRTQEGWSRSENLGDKINTAANEGYPFVDAQGRLFFCSKGHPGYGGFDIFMTEKDANGNWKAPVNLGAPINTPRDDISIYIAPDAKKGMFTSNRSGGDDDIYLFEIGKKPRSKEVVIIEEKKEIEEEILVLKKPISEAKKNIVATEKETVASNLEGTVQDSIVASLDPVSNEIIAEKIEVVDTFQLADIPAETENKDSLSFQKEVGISEMSANEPIEITLAEKLDSLVTNQVKAEELPQKDNSEALKNTPLEEEMKQKKIQVDIPIAAEEIDTMNFKAPNFFYLDDWSQMQQGSRLIEGQIFRIEEAKYDFEAYEVTPQIEKELVKIVDFLQQHPEAKIEIAAHTESRGKDKNNLLLSRYRADAAKAFLVKQGIEKARLESIGYGEQHILNNCVNKVNCSEEEHLYNQRLEMKILKLSN